MVEFLSRSAGATRRYASTILEKARERKVRPIILALVGELGSGKTTFIQGLAKSLAIREKIQSPTFVLAKWYQLPRRWRPLQHFIHIDAYRLDGPAEARVLGLPSLFKDPHAIIVIEWADRIRKLVPKHATWISFAHRIKNSRLINSAP